MNARAVDVQLSTGRILCSTIFRAGGKKLLAKGHVISEQDATMLLNEGLDKVWVTELEEGEVGEDHAVIQVAAEIGCGSVEILLAAGGRANLVATETCCALVDEQLLRQINCAGSVVIATAWNFSYARAGQRIATVKSTPFAVAQTHLDATISILKENGPVLQARPVRAPGVAVLYCDPHNGNRARQLFENTVRQRLERYGTSASLVLSAVEEPDEVSRSLQHLLRAKPACILIASTTAPAGPDDVVGQAMVGAGCQIEHFLAPVEPGNLLLLGYRDEVPVVSAPGCFRSVKPNVVDMILPAMLAKYRLSGWEIAGLGHRGLLGQC